MPFEGSMDERKRKLERTLAGGDPEARAHLLREKMRSGELKQEQVLLAAQLGDAAAGEIFAGEIDQRLFPASDRQSLQKWVEVFSEKFNEQPVNEAQLRAALAATQRVLFIYDEWSLENKVPRTDPHYSFNAALRYLAEPTQEHSEAADYIGHDLLEGALLLDAPSNVKEAIEAGRHCANAVAYPQDKDHCLLAIEKAASAVMLENKHIVLREEDIGIIQNSIRDNLVPWALGEGDPLIDQAKQLLNEEE